MSLHKKYFKICEKSLRKLNCKERIKTRKQTKAWGCERCGHGNYERTIFYSYIIHLTFCFSTTNNMMTWWRGGALELCLLMSFFLFHQFMDDITFVLHFIILCSYLFSCKFVGFIFCFLLLSTCVFFRFCYVGYYVSSVGNLKQSNFVGLFSIAFSLCFVSSSFIVLGFCVGICMIFWNKPKLCCSWRLDKQHWFLSICSLMICSNKGDKTRFQSNQILKGKKIFGIKKVTCFATMASW